VNREIDLKEAKEEHWKREKTERQKKTKRNAPISARAAMEAREGQHGAASMGQRLPRLD
jgi:hypothetical protein